MDDWEKNGMTRAEQAVERLKKELEALRLIEPSMKYGKQIWQFRKESCQ